MKKDDWFFLLFLATVVMMMVVMTGTFFFSYAIYLTVTRIKELYHKTRDRIISILPKKDGKAEYRKKIKRSFINGLEIELSNFNSYLKGIRVSLYCHSDEEDSLVVTLTDDRFEKEIMRIRIDFEREKVSYSKDQTGEHYINSQTLGQGTKKVLVAVREHLEEVFS